MFIISLMKNSTFFPVVVSLVTAQVLKFIIEIIKNKNINFKYLVSTGGMPSSHSAMVMSLVTTLALTDPKGIDTRIFAVALTFALIVMYDAANIRRSAGEHAALLNKLNKIIYTSNDKIRLNEIDLKELLGHTPIEVFMGAILGIVLPILLNKVLLNKC